MRWRINFGAGMPYVNYHSSSLVFELPRNEWTRVSDSAVAIQSMLGCQKDRWSRILGCRKSMALRVLDLEQYPTLQRIAAQCSWRHIVDGFHTVGQFWNTIFWDDNIDILVNYNGTIILANYNIYIWIPIMSFYLVFPFDGYPCDSMCTSSYLWWVSSSILSATTLPELCPDFPPSPKKSTPPIFKWGTICLISVRKHGFWGVFDIICLDRRNRSIW